jgi:hypothetical protein
MLLVKLKGLEIYQDNKLEFLKIINKNSLF